MSKHEDSDKPSAPRGVNPNYATFQIAKALVASEADEDAVTRARARERASKWSDILRAILSGTVKYGSRAPVSGVPVWATPEVLTGGFATGKLLAGGPLCDHELELLTKVGAVRGDERRALNAYFLTDAGLAELQERLKSGQYEIHLPEEGALLVVAWLVEAGYLQDARQLIDTLAPYFPRMRFYPVPAERSSHSDVRVHVQDVADTIDDLQAIKPNERLLAQKEAVEIWAPFWDQIVSLFLETVEDGWPCRCYPAGWSERAITLLRRYDDLRSRHTRCRKPDRQRGHFGQLRVFLDRCVREPQSLSGREVGRIRVILNRYIAKRGSPESATCRHARRRQAADVSAPTFYEIRRVVISRLAKHPRSGGLDDVSHLQEPVTSSESERDGVPEGTRIPPTIQRKLERSLNETVSVLVERGFITSGEALARVLPQMTSEIRAVGIVNPVLRRLFAATYRAFRRRRSLLLLNLERQVQIEELPWFAAIERHRKDDPSQRELARQTLEELVLLTVTAFPHAIIPNKLLQELRALLKGADLHIPLTDEVAADIFMGAFSDKFVESAVRAAHVLEGTLYPVYYGIDYNEVRSLQRPRLSPVRTWSRRPTTAPPNGLAEYCAQRAGVSPRGWNAAVNGMIIEQQQILTTQNLAVLIEGLNLLDPVRNQARELAERCFVWVCNRHQIKVDDAHAQLIMVKSTAYAWRQMIFFLALLTDVQQADFLTWAGDHFDEQSRDFQERFRPALTGLALAASGHSPESDFAKRAGARRFLGWSTARHWLLPVKAAERDLSLG